MRIRVIFGAVVAVALLAVGVLAGSVMGSRNVAAQTPSATSTPGTTQPGTTPSTPKGNGNNNNAPDGGFRGIGPMGGPGGAFGYGPMEGHGGFGKGPFGGDNANGASREITATTNLITQVKSDLAYAQGKMDTANVERWINSADSLLQSAKSADSSSQYEKASAYARAASQLAEVADTQMAQTLGADKLPSYTQHPGRQEGNHGNHGNGNTTPTAPTQAQASRILQSTYDRLVEEGALIKNATNAGDASTYLTDAQNAYKTAYNSYQAGNYTDAVASARLSGQLAGAAEAVLQANTAPSDSTTPVTVPAPNFQ